MAEDELLEAGAVMSALQIAEAVAVMLFSSAVTWKWLLMEKRKREDKARNDAACFASQTVRRRYHRYTSTIPCTACGMYCVDTVLSDLWFLDELLDQRVIRQCKGCGRTTMTMRDIRC